MATKVGPDGRTHYVYTISGVRVEFPAKAYPTQIAMMDKVSNNEWNNGRLHASNIFFFYLFVFIWRYLNEGVNTVFYFTITARMFINDFIKLNDRFTIFPSFNECNFGFSVKEINRFL